MNDVVLEDDKKYKYFAAVGMILDWNEELLVEKLMDNSDSHDKICEDELLDLPRM